MDCRFSENSDYDCGCKNKQERRICKNEERLRTLSERTDGAAFHTEKKGYNTYVSIAYCNAQHCVDFEPMTYCKYATPTDQKWVGEAATCVVIECRNPEALDKLKSFKDDHGREVMGVRRPCDERFCLIPDADWLQVRSRYCNERYCPYYAAAEKEE